MSQAAPASPRARLRWSLELPSKVIHQRRSRSRSDRVSPERALSAGGGAAGRWARRARARGSAAMDGVEPAAGALEAVLNACTSLSDAELHALKKRMDKLQAT